MDGNPEPAPLHIAPCSHEAAEFAVKRWHYSRAMPIGKVAKFGVWEKGKFVGAVMFGRGASPPLYKSFELKQTELVELVRIALSKHETPVSRILSITLRLFHRSNPGIRAVVSFADMRQGHVGVVYQATGWIYTGSSMSDFFKINGEWKQSRAVAGKYKTSSIDVLRRRVDPAAEMVRSAKHRYFWVFDEKLRPRFLALKQPYPRGGKSGLPVTSSNGGRSTRPHRSTSSAPPAERSRASQRPEVATAGRPRRTRASPTPAPKSLTR